MGAGQPPEVRIVRANRLPGTTTVAAWEGVASTGEQVHLSYRNGELSVMVARPTPAGRTWQTVLCCVPRLIEAEGQVANWERHERILRAGRPKALRALLREASLLRQRLWVEAKGSLRIRPGGGDGATAAEVTLVKMQGWLEARETLRWRLRRLGWLGGSSSVLLETTAEERQSRS